MGRTLQVFIIAFRFAYQAQVIVTEKCYRIQRQNEPFVEHYHHLKLLTDSLDLQTLMGMNQPGSEMSKVSVSPSFSLIIGAEIRDQWH